MAFISNVFKGFGDFWTGGEFSKSLSRLHGNDPAPFRWEARPIDNTGNKVEPGDQIMLACKKFNPVLVSALPPMTKREEVTGFIGWEGKGNEKTAKFYKVGEEDMWDRQKVCIFTIKPTPQNKIALETTIEGLTRQLTDVNKKVTFRTHLNEEKYSTAWKPTKNGYTLHFESQKPLVVSSDHTDILKSDGDEGSDDICLVPIKYNPRATFDWEHRPKTTDGKQVEVGDRITMTVWGKSQKRDHNIISDQWGPGLYVKIDFDNTGTPLVFTVRKNESDGGVNLEVTRGGKSLVMSVPIKEEDRKKVIMVEGSRTPMNLSTGWESVDGGYHLYFKRYESMAVSGQQNLFVEKVETPMKFQLVRASK